MLYLVIETNENPFNKPREMTLMRSKHASKPFVVFVMLVLQTSANSVKKSLEAISCKSQPYCYSKGIRPNIKMHFLAEFGYWHHSVIPNSHSIV